jgi:hypothetical protein
MARSSWESLSPAYRGRLERGGITRQDYLSGDPLSGARGHGKTPERPERAEKNPEKYRNYLADRGRLEKAVQAKKLGYFGEVHKFKADRSKKNVEKNPVTGKRVPLADLRRAATASETQWLQWLTGDDKERWAFLFYH